MIDGRRCILSCFCCIECMSCLLGGEAEERIYDLFSLGGGGLIERWPVEGS